MILVRNGFVKVAETWFDVEPEETIRRFGSSVDAIVFRQTPRPVPGATCERFHTTELDLTQDPETLFSGFNKNTRQNIRRASAPTALSWRHWKNPDLPVLREFCGFFGRFASRKGLLKLDSKRLEVYADAGLLRLSTASKDGCSLVWHGDLVIGGRARALYAASARLESDHPFQHLVGRASRFLLWNDILRHKEAGLMVFDMGGWYGGTEDQPKLRINEFKRGFGGKVTASFNGEIGLSTKGKLYLQLRHSYVGLAGLALRIAARRRAAGLERRRESVVPSA